MMNLTFSHNKIISCPPTIGALQWLNFVITKSDIDFLSKIGSETTGFKGVVNFPFCEPSKKTWKHRRTEFKSMLDG